jgi:uncharacterized protein
VICPKCNKYTLGCPNCAMPATADGLTETATVLSRLCRFGGRTNEAYTVAEHCIRVATCVKALGGTVFDQWEAMHHEDDEVLLGFDPASPLLKLTPDLRALKHRASVQARRRYGLPGDEMPAIVKRADMILLATEKRDLMGPCKTPGAKWIALPDPLPEKITPFRWGAAGAAFVDHWQELAAAVGYADA